MTPKQQLFVLEYLKDLNATQAAIRAGYSARNARSVGSENLTKPDIQAAIDAAKSERSAAVKIDAAWVLRELVELHGRCMQEIRPMLDRKGNQVVDDEGNALFVFRDMGAARALELIGKHVEVTAFGADKLDVNVTDGLGERIRRAKERARVDRDAKDEAYQRGYEAAVRKLAGKAASAITGRPVTEPSPNCSSSAGKPSPQPVASEDPLGDRIARARARLDQPANVAHDYDHYSQDT